MRKFLFIVLIAPCGLCFCQDSDSLQRVEDTVSMPAVPGQQMPHFDDGSNVEQETTIRIQREEVPVFLQKILQDEKYRGWENGGVYRNEQGSKFKVEVMDAMNNRTFYFDKDGTLLTAK